MARIKWEDRRYNSYFTIAGIGKGPKTRPDKDLKRAWVYCSSETPGESSS